MSVLASARSEDLTSLFGTIEQPATTTLRAAEIGMVMVRGRAGGVGAAFNLGEMTVARAAVRLEGGVVGIGYVAGRDREAAEAAALVDAMMQSPAWRASARDAVIAPLAEAARQRRAAQQAQVAATKVEFFTLVREREPA